MEIKYLDFTTEIKASEKGEARVFEAYASTFGNVDHHNDVIMRGAFAETIKSRLPKFAYQHDIQRLPGVLTALEEDEKGLLVRGEFINTPLGDQAYEEVKKGAINQLSIGYSVNDAEYNDDGIRFIKSLTLYEVSLVTFPANEEALVTMVKSAGIKTIRDYETFLRDAGFSKSDAKRFALHGFKTSEEIQRDASESDLKQSLENLTKKIKEA